MKALKSFSTFFRTGATIHTTQRAQLDRWHRKKQNMIIRLATVLIRIEVEIVPFG